MTHNATQVQDCDWIAPGMFTFDARTGDELSCNLGSNYSEKVPREVREINFDHRTKYAKMLRDSGLPPFWWMREGDQ